MKSGCVPRESCSRFRSLASLFGNDIRIVGKIYLLKWIVGSLARGSLMVLKLSPMIISVSLMLASSRCIEEGFWMSNVAISNCFSAGN
jgi:hypothetical protein